LNGTRHDLLQSPGRHSLPLGDAVSPVEGALFLDVRLDRQIAKNGCGAHAAAAMLDYWSRSVPSGNGPPPSGAQLYRDSPPRSSDGYSLGQLSELLEAQGLSAVAVRTTSDSLRSELRNGRPAIARVGLGVEELMDRTILPYGTPVLGDIERFYSRRTWAVMGLFGARWIDHYWLVAGFTQTHMLVVDPIMGVRQVRMDHFERAFSRGGQLAIVSGGWKGAERARDPILTG
jgi:predicted double-glycine peptidase